MAKFSKKSLNGHAIVVGGHATVGRLSNNVFFSTFQAKLAKLFKKVAERSRDSRRRSRDRRPTVKQIFLDVSSQMAKLFKKVAERSRDSRRRSRDRRPTVEQLLLDVSSQTATFSKKSLNGHAMVV